MRDSDEFFILGYLSIGLINALFKWNCWPVDAKFVYHLLKFLFSLIFLNNFPLMMWHSTNIFLFTPNDLLKLENNFCRILRFLNYLSSLLDFLVLVLLNVDYWHFEVLFDFILVSFSYFYCYITYIQILHLSLEKLNKLWNKS